VESMADFVGQQQVVDLAGHASPVRHVQGASGGVEPRILALGVEQDGDVLRGHDASKHGSCPVGLISHCTKDGRLVVVVVEHAGIVPHNHLPVKPVSQDSGRFPFLKRLKYKMYISYFIV
jgi:hypothetical protein